MDEGETTEVLNRKVVSPLSSRPRDRFGGDKDEDNMTSRVVKGA